MEAAERPWSCPAVYPYATACAGALSHLYLSAAPPDLSRVLYPGHTHSGGLEWILCARSKICGRAGREFILPPTRGRGREVHTELLFRSHLGTRSCSQGCCPHSAFVPCSKDTDFHFSSLNQPLFSTGGPESRDWALQTAARTGIGVPGISPSLLNVRGFSAYSRTRHKARANLLMLFPSTRLMKA